MTEDEALVRLKMMLTWDAEPTLTLDEMLALIDLARRPDADGLAPSEDDWVPTFDLEAAAAEGWSWKANQVVPRFDVTVDGDSFRRAQIYAHCRRQSSHYANKIVGNLGVKRATYGS